MRTVCTRSLMVVASVVSLSLGLLLPHHADAVVNWTRQNSGNPVLERGAAGQWDAGRLERPTVIKDGSSYEMWYTGKKIVEGSGNTMYVGHASSSDGISWTKYGSNPVLSPSSGVSGALDTGHVGWCYVLDAGAGTYKMWYTGTTQYNDASSELSAVSGFQIFYATSTDGGNTWTKYNNATGPAVPIGSPGAWDQDGVAVPCVLHDPDSANPYKMWYMGGSVVSNQIMIGYAWSNDGINWTKRSTPVLNLGPVGAWDSIRIGMPTVIKEGPLYRMWFEAGYGDYHGYAWSMDGINWNKYDGNPVFMKSPWGSGAFDTDGAMMPMVIKDGNTYKMWYVGDKDCTSAPNSCISAIGYATSQAYQGNWVGIDQAAVRTWNSASGVSLLFLCIPEGPGPLDINELKVVFPTGGVSRFSDSNKLRRWDGAQLSLLNITPPGGSVPSGTYTFYLTSNNVDAGTAAMQLVFPSPTSLSVPQDGPSYLDRQIVAGTSLFSGSSEYVSSTTPAFKWKPYLGDNYYYSVTVFDWSRGPSVQWFRSNPTIGSSKGGDGYMSVSVPAGYLKPDSAYQWRMEVWDSPVGWCAFNSSMSAPYWFYTGTRDTSAPYDFISPSTTQVISELSFRDGAAAQPFIAVTNLAPWDVATSGPNASGLFDSSGNTIWAISPYSDTRSFTSTPFLYMRPLYGYGLSGASGPYTFRISDGANSAVSSVPFTAVTPQQVDRRDMSPADNSYLSGTSFVLSWQSKGDAYKYRVRIMDWDKYDLIYTSFFQPGRPAGQTMSASIPNGVLKPFSPYHWFVETYDTTVSQNRTRSNWLSFMTGPGPQGGGRMTSWGSNKFAAVFTNYGSGNGLWSYNGSSWSKLTDWIPSELVSWGSTNLAAIFTNYGSGNGIWSYNGSSWSKLTDWVPDRGKLKSWGSGNIAGVFTNYGSGNGVWSYNGAYWQYLTSLSPTRLEAWGGTKLAGIFTDFSTPGGSGNGLWSCDGNSWSHLTSWVPTDLKSWGSNIAGIFTNYGSGNGLWSYNGSSWNKLTDWVPNEMDSWGSGSIAGIFTNYGSGNGIWSYNGTSWSHLTSWVPVGNIRWGSGNLGSAFSSYGSGNGVWSYNGSSWSKLTDWVPQDGVAWGSSFAGVFANYGSGCGIWSYNGSSWSKLTDWVPAYAY